MNFKPTRLKIIWSIIIGLLSMIISTIIIDKYYCLPKLGGSCPFFTNETFSYLLVYFLIPAVIVYMVFKFIEDVMKLIGTFLASRPITLIVGFVCIAQGILLLLGNNLFTLLLS